MSNRLHANRVLDSTGNAVIAAVIDSGWDRSIQDNRVMQGVGLVHPDEPFHIHQSSDDHDRNGHGTACTNLLMSIADCAVVPVRVFGSKLETSPRVLIRAIEWAREAGIKLANLSVGTARKDCALELYHACRKAAADGMILVAAANDIGGPWLPAAFKHVLSVGRARVNDLTVLTYHPGEAVECRLRTHSRPVKWLGNQPSTMHGSSFAAPVVTGLVAQWLRDQPDLNVEGVRRRLASADGVIRVGSLA